MPVTSRVFTGGTSGPLCKMLRSNKKPVGHKPLSVVRFGVTAFDGNHAKDKPKPAVSWKGESTVIFPRTDSASFDRACTTDTQSEKTAQLVWREMKRRDAALMTGADMTRLCEVSRSPEPR